MKVLLVSPSYPDTFWSFKHALPFVGRKVSLPPLGLLTVSSLLPAHWEKKLVDMSARHLKDEDILWADWVFVGGMIVQKKSAQEVIDRVKHLGKKVAAGGPMFTTGYRDFTGVDTFVLNEGEPSIFKFAADIEAGTTQHIYSSEEKPDITKTPVPDWSLLKMKDYASMAMQVSRGCPFDCEFCDIVVINGRVPRVKTPEQVIMELDSLYKTGYRGTLFIVDDNFIGNKMKVKAILREIGAWMRTNNKPFILYTEASINLADDKELMDLMREANFNAVFVGIETPSQDALVSCGKVQNVGLDLVEKVKILQRSGLQVQAGFILGFDSDSPKIFDDMIEFVQKTGIVTAMVGLLNALPETKLYKRLEAAGRLLKKPSNGNNTDFTMNFTPTMDAKELAEGYKKVLNSIFGHKNFYARCTNFLKEYNMTAKESQLNFVLKIKAVTAAVWKLGIFSKGKRYFWKMILWTIFMKPKLIGEAVTLAIHGYHFRAILTNTVSAV